MKTEQLYNLSSMGTYGAFSLDITVGAPALPDLTEPAIRDAAYKAAALIESAVMASVVMADPKAQERAKGVRAGLMALFGTELIYVEELPNGYCSEWCCRHLPWFKVTTRVGHFVVGWRKRVINIDWTETSGTETSTELFPGEDVTKWDRAIHAYGLDKASDYIKAIINSGLKGIQQ